jgi:hypothetical protein
MTKVVGTAGARSLMGAGVTAALLGIALSAGRSPELGSWVTVTALLLLIYALHRFGRSGADAPTLAAAPRRARKKKSGA